jgi:hypothetical protein
MCRVGTAFSALVVPSNEQRGTICGQLTVRSPKLPAGQRGSCVVLGWRDLQRFGAPECPKCRDPMRIIRRGVRVDAGGYYERQEFTCRICFHIVEREVATDGRVRGTTLAAQM